MTNEHSTKPTEAPKPNLDVIKQFLSTLDRQVQNHVFRCIKKGEYSRNSKSLDEVLLENTNGTDTFVTINKLRNYDESATKENIESVRALFLDIDFPIEDITTFINDLPLQPSFVLNSSPNKYHFYFWTCEVPIEHFTAFQKHIACKYKGDKAVSDLPRVMRLPGSIHWKDPQNPFVTVQVGEMLDFDYEYQELKEAFRFTESSSFRNTESKSPDKHDGSKESLEFVEALLDYLDPRTHTYPQWRDVGFALADYFELEPDIGKDLFLKYSERDDQKRFNSKDAERQYYYGKPNKGKTISTLYKMASHSGANIKVLMRKHRRHAPAFSPIHELRKPITIDTTPIEQGINYRPDFPYTNGNNKPIATIDNLEIILSQLDCIVRQNVISKEIEIQFPNTKFCTDNAKNAALATLKSEARKFGMASVADVPELIIPISDKNQFNPVLNYITSAPWDGQDRFKELSDTIVSRTCQTLKNELLKTWCLSAVAVATDPDATAQGILVFTGNQGIGKTRWFNSLVPPNLDLTKAGALLKPDDRDSVYQVLKYWLVELGELDATFKKTDIAQLKAFITKDTDELRLPYERYTSKWRRRTIFFASVNEESFLVDKTGNRRFWVIDVENIVADHGIDMQQFWAQMYANYLNGDKHYLESSTLKLLNEQNTKFTQINPIEERVATMLDWESPKERWSYKTSVEIAELIDSKDLKPAQLNVMLAKVRELNGNLKIKRKAHMFLCPEKKTISPTFPPTNTDSKVDTLSP